MMLNIQESQISKLTILCALTALFSIAVVSNVSAASSTLSLTISSSTIKASTAPVSANGTFAKATASTITATTNNTTGYTLSISAPTSAGADYDKLINTTDSSSKLNSISSPTTEEQYKALNNTSYNNTWGYLPSKYCSDGTSSTCASNTSFLPAPTTTGDVLDQTTAANATANSYTIGMGTRIDSSTKTGSYKNTYIIKLVANAIPYTIIYNDGVVSNMPTDVSGTTPDSTVSISSNTPVRAGYKFLGWCTVVPTNNNGTDTCTGGTTYQPSATLTIDQTGTGNNFHFYAMWQEPMTFNKAFANAGKTQLNGYYKMQDANASICSVVDQGQTGTLIDTRDNQTYAVAKLADGKCWFLDNLALDLTNSTILNSLSADNTNINTTTDPGALAALKGTSVRDPNTDSTGKYATTGVTNWTSSYSYSAPLVNLTNKDVVPTDATSASGGYKVGGYYNYCAASAGSYCYGNGTSAGTSSGNATSDICPKGWRMPTGNSSGEYQTLYNNSNYNTYANYRSALRLPLSGYFYSGTADSQGSRGYFWSSTRYSNDFMYHLYVITSGINPASSDLRSLGFSVRCVLGS